MSIKKRLIQEAEKIIRSIVIPSPPKILIQIQEEMAKPEPEYSRIIQKVQEDISLTARIIKVANSPFFGMRCRIDSVKEALPVLGLDHFNQIVLASAMREAFSAAGMGLKELETFHTHSTRIAGISSSIARYLRDEYQTETNPALAYMTGLFHDCGMVMLANRFKDYYSTIRTNFRNDKSLIKIEEGLYQTNHCLIGAFVARAWELPDVVCDAIGDHHEIDLGHYANHDLQRHIAIVVLAEGIDAQIPDELDDRYQLYQQQPRPKPQFHSLLRALGLKTSDVGHLIEQIKQWDEK
jgi:putative nucleotidyltransferase with HDIG domain